MRLELETAFTGPHDRANAILMIHSGEGGIDAQDWSEMLLADVSEMGRPSGLSAELLDTTPGEEAGIKNGTLEISGPFAYGYAKAEAGSHRLGAALPVRFGAPAPHGVRAG